MNNSLYPKYYLFPYGDEGGGETYRVTWDMRTASVVYPESLNVKLYSDMGGFNQAGVQALEVPIQSIASFVNFSQTPLYANFSYTFTVTASGNYHIGFHAVSPPDRWRIDIDNYKIEKI